ncbi:MAG: hypothetical protein ACLUFV_10910 [Acutalibacteraceae bacterium]
MDLYISSVEAGATLWSYENCLKFVHPAAERLAPHSGASLSAAPSTPADTPLCGVSAGVEGGSAYLYTSKL